MIMPYHETAKFFGCSLSQLKEHYLQNAETLRGMYNKAVLTSEKINGFTADQLQQMNNKYLKLAESCPLS